jgi:thiamine kinase-like enzyme
MKDAPPRASPEARERLARRRAALLSPGAAARLLSRHLGARLRGAAARVEDESPDRFVLRVDAEAADGAPARYAFKVYADERGARLWRIAATLRMDALRADDELPLCLPLAYVEELGLTILPWLGGRSLREAIRAGDPALVARTLQHAPAALARVHRARLPAEAPRSAEASVARARHRCAKFARWPDMQAEVDGLLGALEAALPALARTVPAFVHGDPGPANLLYDAGRCRLIDLDRCGWADPAHDVGYLLAQLTRRGLEQPALAPLVAAAAAGIAAGYHAHMPGVAARNVAFYFAATLAQKLFMTWREHPADPRAAVRPLIARARAALEDTEPAALAAAAGA